MIKNKNTGQIYIGQSKNIEMRFNSHCYVSKIDLDIANNGRDNFDFIIIEELDESQLDEREKYWISYYDTYQNDFHYNSQPGGVCGSPQNLLDGGLIKYTLWNAEKCLYEKYTMCRRNRTPNPCGCFRVKFNKYRIPMGRFYDFVSCELINQLIEEAIENEVE